MLLQSSALLDLAAWVAIASVKGTVLIAAVTIFRRLLNLATTSTWRHALWLPVLVCLICPLGPGVPLIDALPRTDVALRRQLEAWERMARASSEPPAPIVRTVKGLGTFEGLKFIKTGPHGMDVYEATFSKGELRCFIMPLTSGGRVNGLECHDVLRPGA